MPSLPTLMELALTEAAKARAAREVPVGAVLWGNGTVLSTGHNTREALASPLGHAEITTIESYCRTHSTWRLPTDSILVVTSEPCLMCTGYLLQARVGTVVYGCRDTKNASLRVVLPQIQAGVFDHRFEVIEGVLAESAGQILSEFFRERRVEQRQAATTVRIVG